jgi:hypothetical protein
VIARGHGGTMLVPPCADGRHPRVNVSLMIAHELKERSQNALRPGRQFVN